MPDPIYADARLARLYDLFDPDRTDLQTYRDVAREVGAGTVLDLGCGTGTLALLLAADGREVIGVDPAGASLDVARGKDTAGRVRWYHGDATSLPPLAVDLVTMTGNVAQVFLDDVSWSATLRGIHDALVPGGHLCFETRRTAARAWEEWAAPSEPRSRCPACRSGTPTGCRTGRRSSPGRPCGSATWTRSPDRWTTPGSRWSRCGMPRTGPATSTWCWPDARSEHTGARASVGSPSWSPRRRSRGGR
jgi:SAM-dependent methyltransferase